MVVLFGVFVLGELGQKKARPSLVALLKLRNQVFSIV